MTFDHASAGVAPTLELIIPIGIFNSSCNFLAKKYPTAEKSEIVVGLQTFHLPLKFDNGFNDKLLLTFMF